jgi:N-acetylneuraminic acid mutarotase
VLQNNGGDNLSVSANGSFTFKTTVVSGGGYSVTILTQPANPAQTCGVTNRTGTATANVTNVMVDCGHNEWTWMGGSNLANMPAVYGTQGTPSASNTPGKRDTGVVWTDTSGNVWTFGGADFVNNFYSDLWKYSNGQWTWMGGSDLPNKAGIYGTLGTPSAANIPGGRAWGSLGWIDSSGTLWLFGGQGYDSAGTNGDLNDLWKYSNGKWTWIGGSNVANQKGIYGTLGTPSANNIPGARRGSVAWVDSQGNMWLFGGFGYDSAGAGEAYLNDLWKYNNGKWTWMGGSNVANQKGIYGTLGVTLAANIPGGRGNDWLVTDPSGNGWLFGGSGYDSTGTLGSHLNDLWKFSNGQWTWMAGSNLANPMGTYGTNGVPSAANTPGGRYNAFVWADSSGNVWLFGGHGYDSTGKDDRLNDLWKFSSGQWTWMGGSDLADQAGTYGTMGTPNPSNVPGARGGPMTWIDEQGNLWLFGGTGHDSAGTLGDLNDVWRYEP